MATRPIRKVDPNTLIIVDTKAAAVKSASGATTTSSARLRGSAKPATVKRGRVAHLSPEALEHLILEHREHGKRLAWSFLTSWRIRLPQDEVLSIVGAALCEAGTRFDPERGVDFKTFFYYHLRGMLLKEIARMIQEQKLLQFVPHTVLNGANTPDSQPHATWNIPVVETNNPERILEKREVASRCWEACAQLDPLEQEVISRFFVYDQPLVQIAEELSYCRCHISRVKSRALSKLSKAMAACSVDSDGEINELELARKTKSTRRVASKRKTRNYTGGRGRRREMSFA